MLDHRTDAVPVVDDDGRLLGLITVWQYLEFIAAASMADCLLRHDSRPAPEEDEFETVARRPVDAST